MANRVLPLELFGVRNWYWASLGWIKNAFTLTPRNLVEVECMAHRREVSINALVHLPWIKHLNELDHIAYKLKMSSKLSAE